MNIFRFSGLLTALVLSSSVLADDLLDRLETATEIMGEKQGTFYLSRVPELTGKMPDWTWDEEIRTASACVLTGIENAKGRKVAEAYVAALEKDAKQPITSIGQLSDQSSLPKELTGNDRTIISLMESCRTMEISTSRLKESGFWDAMQDPNVIQRLVAE
jgi:hypothetical protein